MKEKNNPLPPDIVPRSAAKMVTLFEALLFFRIPKDAHDLFPYEQPPKEIRRALSPKGIQYFANTKAINRIFRAWFQLTWGEGTENDFFDGFTPRQELGEHMPDIKTGDAMISVSLSITDISHPIILPRVFNRESFAEYGGPFVYAIAECARDTENALVAPNFDPGFRVFFKNLKKMRGLECEGDAPLAALAQGISEEAYWFLHFFETWGERVLAPYTAHLTKSELSSYAEEINTIFRFYMFGQKEGHMQYIPYDVISSDIWEVLQTIDPKLPPHTFINEIDPNKEYYSPENSRDVAYAHAIATFHKLHYVMDRDIFFPADRYFNAIEIVWQDKETFLQNLNVFFSTLAKGSPLEKAHIPKHDVIALALRKAGLDEHTTHIDKMWFNPCTCFRLLERVSAYL